MACLYCKHYKGWNEFCSCDKFIETGMESVNCDKYRYNRRLRYYNFFSEEKEVKIIIKNLFFYFLTVSLDEIALGFERDYIVYLTDQESLALNNILEELEERHV